MTDKIEFPTEFEVATPSKCETCAYMEKHEDTDWEGVPLLGKCCYLPIVEWKYPGDWCSKYYPNAETIEELQTQLQQKLLAAETPGDGKVN